MLRSGAHCHSGGSVSIEAYSQGNIGAGDSRLSSQAGTIQSEAQVAPPHSMRQRHESLHSSIRGLPSESGGAQKLPPLSGLAGLLSDACRDLNPHPLMHKRVLVRTVYFIEIFLIVAFMVKTRRYF